MKNNLLLLSLVCVTGINASGPRVDRTRAAASSRNQLNKPTLRAKRKKFNCLKAKSECMVKLLEIIPKETHSSVVHIALVSELYTTVQHMKRLHDRFPENKKRNAR